MIGVGRALAQEINCVNNAGVSELMRGLRSQLSELISGLAGHDMAPMSLGLSHSLSRYKLKFSPDKVDTMIVQAIGLLDDLDKELNTYAMRVREWYGWHFPELAKIVADNVQYAKAVKVMGSRTNAADLDFSGVSAVDVWLVGGQRKRSLGVLVTCLVEATSQVLREREVTREGVAVWSVAHEWFAIGRVERRCRCEHGRTDGVGMC